MQQFVLEKQNVIGLALNYKDQLIAWNNSFNDKPYQKPPQRSVYYVKAKNTFNQTDIFKLPVSKNNERIQACPGLGVVIGKTACRLESHNVLDYIKGFVIYNDFSYPTKSFYRPDIYGKCQDGSLVISQNLYQLDDYHKLNELVLGLTINGAEKMKFSTGEWVKKIEDLLIEITDFMLLKEDDVILTGTPNERYSVQANDDVHVILEGTARLTTRIE